MQYRGMEIVMKLQQTVEYCRRWRPRTEKINPRRHVGLEPFQFASLMSFAELTSFSSLGSTIQSTQLELKNPVLLRTSQPTSRDISLLDEHSANMKCVCLPRISLPRADSQSQVRPAAEPVAHQRLLLALHSIRRAQGSLENPLCQRPRWRTEAMD
jgi:hypothetical protein